VVPFEWWSAVTFGQRLERRCAPADDVAVRLPAGLSKESPGSLHLDTGHEQRDGARGKRSFDRKGRALENGDAETPASVRLDVYRRPRRQRPRAGTDLADTKFECGGVFFDDRTGELCLVDEG